MMHTNEPDVPQSSPGSNEDVETDVQRRKRQAEADEAWEQSEQQRRDDEIQRRVKEHWRNPRQ